MQNRQILLVIPSMASAGGAEKLVDNLSKIFKQEYQTSIVSFDPPGTAPYFKCGVPFYPIGDSPGRAPRFRLLAYIRMAMNLAALKRKLGADITLSVLWRADLINALSHRSGKIGSLAVINLRGNRTHIKMVKLRQFVGLIYRRFNMVFSINPAISNEYRELFGLASENIRLFRNFTDRPQYQRFFSDHACRYVFCGRLVYEKNIDGLLRIWADYIHRNPGRQLVLIGDGPLHNELESFAIGLGLTASHNLQDVNAQVLFAGSTDTPEAYLDGARALLLTSRHEGVPTIVLVAASLGLPLIAADCHGGGVRHLFAVDRTTPLSDISLECAQSKGILLPIPDSPATTRVWVEAMERIDRDEALRAELSRRALQLSAEHSYEAVRQDWSLMMHQLSIQP